MNLIYFESTDLIKIIAVLTPLIIPRVGLATHGSTSSAGGTSNCMRLSPVCLYEKKYLGLCVNYLIVRQTLAVDLSKRG